MISYNIDTVIEERFCVQNQHYHKTVLVQPSYWAKQQQA